MLAACAGAACTGALPAASTSCTRTRPSGSTTGTAVKSIPFSRANFLAAGEAITVWPDEASSALGACCAGAGAAFGASASATAGAASACETAT